jgi:MoaA/NifB/PqqE/SkfB family radical SAM enzyme
MYKKFDLIDYLKISGVPSAEKRRTAEKQGIHVPVFLQADIVSRCNLSCQSCYWKRGSSCQNGSCLKAEEWDAVFRDAEKLGVRFMILSGGEPLLEKEILIRASHYPNSWFLVFTNGTLLNQDYYLFFSNHRNLVPILCQEVCMNFIPDCGNKSSSLYGSMMCAIEEMEARDLIYGAAVALTRENRNRVVSRGFLDVLNRRKCNGVVYVEYGLEEAFGLDLMLGEKERDQVEEELAALQKEFHDMVFLTFPREGRLSERAFFMQEQLFYITADGYVGPKLYRNIYAGNVKQRSLRDILKEEIFVKG